MILAHEMKLVPGQTSPEDALTTAAYPASGSYIDVSGYEAVEVVIHFGAIHASDAPVLKVKQSDSASGTLDTVDTVNCVHTAAADDDDECVTFHVQTRTLATDHHFVALSITGGASNGSYGDIMFYLSGARHLPVTQTTAVLPTASQHIRAG